MRLIDADKFILALMDASLASVDEDTILDLIDTVDTIEAKPVVHGQWEESDWTEPDNHGFGVIWILNAGLRCSNCKNVFRKKLLWKENYCPNCGAKMDGDKKTDE